MLVWFKEENLQIVGAKLSYEYIISLEKFASIQQMNYKCL